MFFYWKLWCSKAVFEVSRYFGINCMNHWYLMIDHFGDNEGFLIHVVILVYFFQNILKMKG